MRSLQCKRQLFGFLLYTALSTQASQVSVIAVTSVDALARLAVLTGISSQRFVQLITQCSFENLRVKTEVAPPLFILHDGIILQHGANASLHLSPIVSSQVISGYIATENHSYLPSCSIRVEQTFGNAARIVVDIGGNKTLDMTADLRSELRGFASRSEVLVDTQNMLRRSAAYHLKLLHNSLFMREKLHTDQYAVEYANQLNTLCDLIRLSLSDDLGVATRARLSLLAFDGSELFPIQACGFKRLMLELKDVFLDGNVLRTELPAKSRERIAQSVAQFAHYCSITELASARHYRIRALPESMAAYRDAKFVVDGIEELAFVPEYMRPGPIVTSEQECKYFEMITKVIKACDDGDIRRAHELRDWFVELAPQLKARFFLEPLNHAGAICEQYGVIADAICKAYIDVHFTSDGFIKTIINDPLFTKLSADERRAIAQTPSELAMFNAKLLNRLEAVQNIARRFGIRNEHISLVQETLYACVDATQKGTTRAELIAILNKNISPKTVAILCDPATGMYRLFPAKKENRLSHVLTENTWREHTPEMLTIINTLEGVACETAQQRRLINATAYFARQALGEQQLHMANIYAHIARTMHESIQHNCYDAELAEKLVAADSMPYGIKHTPVHAGLLNKAARLYNFVTSMPEQFDISTDRGRSNRAMVDAFTHDIATISSTKLGDPKMVAAFERINKTFTINPQHTSAELLADWQARFPIVYAAPRAKGRAVPLVVTLEYGLPPSSKQMTAPAKTARADAGTVPPYSQKHPRQQVVQSSAAAASPGVFVSHDEAERAREEAEKLATLLAQHQKKGGDDDDEDKDDESPCPPPRTEETCRNATFLPPDPKFGISPKIPEWNRKNEQLAGQWCLAQAIQRFGSVYIADTLLKARLKIVMAMALVKSSGQRSHIPAKNIDEQLYETLQKDDGSEIIVRRIMKPKPEHYIRARKPGPTADEHWCADQYDAIRNDMNDTEIIARNTGIAVWLIECVKKHLFFDAHIVTCDNGVCFKRFDPMPVIVEVWDRLKVGDFIENDIKLIEHEYTESCIEHKLDTNYKTAHYITQLKNVGSIWHDLKSESKNIKKSQN